MSRITQLVADAAKKADATAKDTTAAVREHGKSSKNTGIFTRLARLYSAMEAAYKDCAAEAGLSCAGCGNNCCTSFFQHHTYMEWAYLWRGLQELPEGRRKGFLAKAKAYVEEARQSLAADKLPTAMCPLNEDGLCALYSHRLMICRLHGTRNVFTLPDGRQQVFPGCYRFAALPCAQEEAGNPCPSLDRTPFYRELASLELEFLKRAGRALPKVDLTLAEMIVLGPPKLR